MCIYIYTCACLWLWVCSLTGMASSFQFGNSDPKYLGRLGQQPWTSHIIYHNIIMARGQDSRLLVWVKLGCPKQVYGLFTRLTIQTLRWRYPFWHQMKSNTHHLQNRWSGNLHNYLSLTLLTPKISHWTKMITCHYEPSIFWEPLWIIFVDSSFHLGWVGCDVVLLPYLLPWKARYGIQQPIRY